MKRTHVFLPEPMLQALKAMSVEHDVTVSELIRVAVGLLISPPSRKIDNLIGMTTVGSWEDAPDLGAPFAARAVDSSNQPMINIADPVSFLSAHLPNFVRVMGGVSADGDNIGGFVHVPHKAHKED